MLNVLLFGYLAVTVVVTTVAVSLYLDSDGEEVRKRLARLILAAPLWPLIAARAVAAFIAVAVRDAGLRLNRRR
jgi:hypothetical protein